MSRERILFVPGFFNHNEAGAAERTRIPLIQKLRGYDVTSGSYEGESIPDFVEDLRRRYGRHTGQWFTAIVGYSSGLPLALEAFNDWPVTFIGVNPVLPTGLTWRGFLTCWRTLFGPFNKGALRWALRLDRAEVGVPTVGHALDFFFGGNQDHLDVAKYVAERCHPTAFQACLDLSFPGGTLGAPIARPNAQTLRRTYVLCGADDQVVTAEEWLAAEPLLVGRIRVCKRTPYYGGCYHGSLLYNENWGNIAAGRIIEILTGS